MHRTIDPLTYLRENIQKNKKIVRDGDSLIFDDGIKLKLDTQTALMQSQSENKKYYTLGSLWLFLKNKDLRLVEYMHETQSQHIDAVVGIDKDKIKDFFINNTDNIEILDNNIRPKTLISLGKKTKGENLDELYKTLKENKSSEENKASKIKIEKQLNLLKQREEELKDPNLAIMNYIYTNEKKSLNRNSLMKPYSENINFENLMLMSKKIFDEGLNQSNKVKSFLDELTTNNDELVASKVIIIVPMSFSEGNICYKNARAFLQSAKYIDVNCCTEEEKELCVDDDEDNTFTYKIKGRELPFEICSNVRKFTKNDWKRVVAVFVQGEEWEFKDWPKAESAYTILQKVKGFYLKYLDMPLSSTIKNWNVEILEISRVKRHLDVSIQNDFWNILSEFLSHPRRR